MRNTERGFIAAAWLLAALHASARCEDGLDAAARAKTVAPWIDEQTVAVVRADLARVDLDAAAKSAVAIAPDAKEDIEQALRQARAWLDAFRKAGGRDAYVLVSLADISLTDGAMALVAVPLREGADAKALAALFPPPLATREAPGRILLAAPAAVLKRLETLQPDQRPEFAAAFQAAGDAPVQALLLPPKYSRRVIEEMMPRLPEPLGGGPSSVVTRGVRWAAVGIELPPKAALRLLVQSESPNAAEEMEALLVRALREIARQDDVRQAVPDIEGLVPHVTPKAQGGRLVLSLDSKSPAGATLAKAGAELIRRAFFPPAGGEKP